MEASEPNKPLQWHSLNVNIVTLLSIKNIIPNIIWANLLLLYVVQAIFSTSFSVLHFFNKGGHMTAPAALH